MQRAQLVTFGVEDRLADLLRGLAQEKGLWLRSAAHVKTCLSLAGQGANVLVLRVGKDLEREMQMLEQVTRLFPATKTIVVGNVPNAPLAALAWDLGAAYVLFPPQPIEALRDIVLGFIPTSDTPPPRTDPSLSDQA